MAFEQFLNQVVDENKLFLFIANDVHSNFTALLDKFFVIHLKDEGEKKASIVKVAEFTEGTVLRAEQPAQAITTEPAGIDELRSRFTDAGEQILKTRRNKAV